MSFECSTCGKIYQRSTHLRRHEATHSGSNYFTCPYCRKSFLRRDVCRKHAASCTARGAADQSGPGEIRTVKRGQKSRACDACSHCKLACDLGKPCERCVARQTECTYVKALEDPSNSKILDPLKPHQNREEDERLSIPFLLELTDPSAESMLNTLLKEPEGEDEDSPMVEDHLFSFNTLSEQAFLQDCFPLSFTDLMADEPIIDHLQLDLSEHSECTTSVLEERMDFLISELRQTHESLSSSEPLYDGTFDEAVAKSVLTAHNAKNFITALYRETHRSFPVTHKPSLDYETTIPELLLGLMLNGSERLAPQDDALSATSLYRVAEFYIFRRLEQVIASHGSLRVNGLPPKQVIDMIAAALEIHGVSTATKKTRLDNILNPQRPQILVSIVRDLGLTSVRHPKPLHETAWEDFVATESCIRVAAWVGFTAWQEAGWFNAPPHMAVTEMRSDLPCAPELWDAKDEGTFRSILSEPGYVVAPSASIKDCIEALMQDRWTGVTHFPRAPAHILDMLMLVFAIHGMIASARLMGMLPVMGPSLMRALSRWFEVWEATIKRLGPDKVLVGGLSRHSASLAWLAQGCIQISLLPGPQCAYLRKIGQASLEELHELVQTCRGR